MGCDIHMRAEVKKKYKNPEVKPEWEAVGPIFKSSYFTEGEILTESSYGGFSNAEFTDEPYDGRNYGLFAMLANVRNGYGFAGCDTGDGYKPIFEPRGVPKDASKVWKKQVKEYGIDGHSHSWITLQELLDYDWNQVTIKRGWVSVSEYLVFKEKGKPETYSGGVSGGMVKHVTNKEMDKLIKTKSLPSLKHTYTQVQWKETYAEAAGSFYTDTLPKLQGLLGYKDVLDVRIVFFFDN